MTAPSNATLALGPVDSIEKETEEMQSVCLLE